MSFYRMVGGGATIPHRDRVASVLHLLNAPTRVFRLRWLYVPGLG